jgi:PAS domain S-box-containing protein
VVGTDPEPDFDRITRVAAALFEVPIALISFVAEGREWRKSAVGVESGAGARSGGRSLEPSFCREAIRSGGATVIEDIARAERFSGHPLVEGEPGVRFYAGAPLSAPGGYRIGTLCVLDKAPRSFSEEAARRLEDLAEMVMSELERRRQARQKLQEKDRRLRAIAESVSEGIYRSTPEGELTYANQALAEMFGYDSVEDILEADPCELYADPAERKDVLERTDEQGGLEGQDIEFRRADGSTFVGRVTDTVVRGEDGEVAYYGGVIADVTERRRQEEKLLRQKEELHRQKSLLEQTQRLAGAWEADLKTGEVDWSEKVYEIHEVEPQVPIDLETSLEFYVPEAQEEVQEAADTLVEEGEPYDLELPIETVEGNRRWVRTVGAPVEVEGGEVVKVAGAFQDITERKRAERELERQNDLFRRAQEIADVGAWEYDVRAGEGSMTDQAYNIYGLSPDADVTLQQTISLYHPEAQPTIREAFGRAVEEGKPYDLELRVVTDAGEERWVRVRGKPQRGEGQEVARVRGTIQDITRRKRRERELQKSKRRFQALFDDPNILASLLGKDGKVLEANQTALNYIAEDLEEVVGEPFWETPWWSDQVGGAIRENVQKAAGGTYVEYEADLTRPDGTPYSTAGVFRPVTDERGTVVSLLVTGRDVTARKQRERELRETSATLEAILENLPPGVLAEDADREIVVANQGLCDVLNIPASPEDLEGSDCAEAAQAVSSQFEAPGRFAGRIEELLEQGKSVKREELRLVDGRVLERDFITYTLAGEEAALWLYRDVTERKRKEEKLRERRQQLREEKRRFQAITENVSDGIYRSTEKEGIVYANQAFVEMFGYRDLEELRAAEEEALYADPARREELFEKEAEEGELDREEVRFRRKDGSTFVGLLSSQRVEREDREAKFLDGAITDITERKRYEQKLERQNDLFRKAQSLASVGGWEFGVKNPDERMLTDQGYRIHGLSPDAEMTLEWSLSFYHPEDRPRIQEALAEAVEEGEPYDIEARLIREDGERRWVRTRGEPQRGDDGEVARVRGTIQDITERKRREQALRERQEKIEALYEATGTLLRAEDRSEVPGRLADIAEGALGYPTTTIRLAEDGALKPTCVSEAVRDHMPERPAYDIDEDTPAARAYRAGESRAYDDLSAEAEGLERGDVRAAAYVPMGGHGLISVGSLEVGGIGSFDLRLLEVLGAYAALVLDRIGWEEELIEAKEEAEKARREAEENRRDAEEARKEAEKSRREAEEASRLKSSFLANMSHEIRTPLTSIIGFAEALGTEVSELDLPEGSSLPDYARLIEKGGKRLLKTLEGVLNLSKLEAGQMELEAGPVDLATEVKRAAEELRPKAEEKSVALEVETDGQPVWARADEGGVQIVLQNLLSNAIKYTEEGGVELRTYQEEEEAVLEVEDTGIGMESGMAEDLFEPFRQASEGWGREYEGTGVGLAVTKRAVEEMNGQVEVETQKGEGSRFTVRLPQAEGSALDDFSS